MDAGCDGKKKYRTPREAERAARYCRELRDTRLAQYRCDVCKFWHLATPNEFSAEKKLQRLRREFREKKNPA